MTFEELHPRTRAYLQTVNENEQFARSVLDDAQSTPAALRWAAIALFYAAVHGVNAYFWERARLEPKHHGDREQIMSNWPELVPLVADYMTLKNHAWRTRYAPGAQSPRNLVERLHESRLVPLIDTIQSSLGS